MAQASQLELTESVVPLSLWQLNCCIAITSVTSLAISFCAGAVLELMLPEQMVQSLFTINIE